MSLDWVLEIQNVGYCGNLTVYLDKGYIFGKLNSNEPFIL